MFVSLLLVCFIALVNGYSKPNNHKLNNYIKSLNIKRNIKDYNEKIYSVDEYPEYTIPNWVYKTVFDHNKVNKKFEEKNYIHLIKF